MPWLFHGSVIQMLFRARFFDRRSNPYRLSVSRTAKQARPGSNFYGFCLKREYERCSYDTDPLQ